MKKELLTIISELKADYNEILEAIEWGELEEIYLQASKVLRDIERIEKFIKQL